MANEVKKTEKAGEPVINAKEIQKKAAKENKKIKLTDRMNLEITQDSGHYKKGQRINPHRIYGQALVHNGIAKEVKDEE